MRWGVFRQRQKTHGEIHVAPCDSEGTLLKHHILDVLCPCSPVPEAREISSADVIIAHNEPGLE